MLLCWGCITLSHLLGLWQWCLLSEIQGLACHVFPQNTWLLANLFSLFFFLHKVAYFSLQMGVWGSSEVLFFLVAHTPSVVSWHLRQVPRLSKVSVGQHSGRSGSQPGLVPLCVAVPPQSLKSWALMLWALCVRRACTCPALLTRSKRGKVSVNMHHWALAGGSLVSFSCPGSPLRYAMLLLASCFLELPLS